MRKSILILIIFIHAVTAYAQADRKESVRITNGYEMLDSARAFLETNPERSFTYIEKSLEASLNSGDKILEASNYLLLGKLNKQLGQFQISNSYYNKALLIADNSKNYSLLLDIYIHKAELAAELENYTEAETLLKKALTLSKSHTPGKQVSEIRLNMADLYVMKENYNLAIQLYKEVLAEKEKNNDFKSIYEINEKLGTAYNLQNQESEAISAYQKSAVAADNLNDNKRLSRSYDNMSKVMRKERNYDEALEMKQASQELYEMEEDLPAAAQNKAEMGDIFIEKGETDQAITMFQESIVLSEQSNKIELKGKALKKLSDAYTLKGDYTTALQTYREYAALMDSILSKREQSVRADMDIIAGINRQIQRLNTLENEIELKEKTIYLLEESKKIDQKEIRIHRIITVVFTASFILLVIGGMITLKNLREKKKTNQLLALKSLRSQMNPHFIYNALNSVNHYISINDERAANKFLTDFSKLMRAVMENSKYDMVSLKSEIEIVQLYLKLEQARFSDKFDYQILIDENINTETFEIPPMLIQPYIENAIWHGLRYRTTQGRLKIELMKLGQHIKITIEDNGIGRQRSAELKTEHQKKMNSTGMSNTDTRVRIINELLHREMKISVSDLSKDYGTKVEILI